MTFALPKLALVTYLLRIMSEATFPRVVAKPSATVTVLKTGPFVIRHLAAGKPFLTNRAGRYELVYPQDAHDVPSLRFAENLRYRVNAWLVARGVQWHVPPLEFFPAFNSTRKHKKDASFRARTQARTSGRKRAVWQIEAKRLSKLIGRGVAIVALCFMALMGLTRFVHVDVQAVTQSIHFSIPHFLTPWRKQVDPINAALSGDATSFPGLSYSPAATSASFAMPDAAVTGTPANVDTTDARKGSDSGDRGWIPLPGSGPLPANMPTYGGGGAVHLNIHRPVFSSPDAPPDDEGGENTVRLLTETANVAVAHTDTDTNAVQQPAPVKSAASETPRPTSAKESRKAPRTLAVHTARDTVPQAPERVPEKAVLQQPDQGNASTVDVQLMPTETPNSSLASDENAPAPTVRKSNTNSAGSPTFNVVTKNGASLIVEVHGQMEQVSVGQALPDGSTLLSVPEHGGGFSTSRGDYVAY
ncbi:MULTISPECIES: hypothetical protein [unclassified Paraburkholderia]|uniref:hypothetical protein n=1 Tax=unclassified Paraburkholderia TaxID=2615204 RepID=UPI002AB22B5C|nr:MULTISPECIES: hypothetical protein [unclassified Paraburkholderia]